MEVISGKIDKAKKIVLYGPEGIGKSSLAAQFPAPIFIDTEGSTTEMTVDRLAKPTSWEMLKQQIDWVMTKGYKTLVIDTIDWAEMLCIESVCAAHDKKGIEDFGYGNGYVYTKEEFGRFLNKLQDVIDNAKINVVLVAHSQIIKFEQPDEMGAYDRYQLKLGKKTSSQTAPLVKEWADMVLFINYKTMSVATDDKGRKFKAQGGVRTIYSTHNPAWDAKNRNGLPADFPLVGAYEKYLAPIFDNAPAKQPVAPTATTAPQPTQPESLKSLTGEQADADINKAAKQMSLKDYDPAQLNSAIPKALRDLMMANQVSEEEIQVAVAQKGYYPQGTPIANYDPGFINGVLVGAWKQVFGMIQEFRKSLPF